MHGSGTEYRCLLSCHSKVKQVNGNDAKIFVVSVVRILLYLTILTDLTLCRTVIVI